MLDEKAPANDDISIGVRRENARIGYQMAVTLWTYEGTQTWARFNLILVVNSIFLGAIALKPTNSVFINYIVFPVFGWLLTMSLYLITKRGFDYQNYYVLSARELEEHYLADPIRTVSRGGIFSEGKPVELEITGEHKISRMGKLSRRFKAEQASLFVIVLLTLMFIGCILYGVCLLGGQIYLL